MSCIRTISFFCSYGHFETTLTFEIDAESVSEELKVYEELKEKCKSKPDHNVNKDKLN